MTRVVNKRTHTPSQDDIYIGRGSKWGNPFKMKNESDRDLVIKQYANYILNDGSHLLNHLSEIRGKTLVCFCKPKSCHGDILAILCDEIYTA